MSNDALFLSFKRFCEENNIDARGAVDFALALRSQQEAEIVSITPCEVGFKVALSNCDNIWVSAEWITNRDLRVSDTVQYTKRCGGVQFMRALLEKRLPSAMPFMLA